MLEVHDMPEAIHSDVITLHGVDREQEAKDKDAKFEREYAAMCSIIRDLGPAGEQMLGLWLRFEKGNDRTHPQHEKLINIRQLNVRIAMSASMALRVLGQSSSSFHRHSLSRISLSASVPTNNKENSAGQHIALSGIFITTQSTLRLSVF